MRSLWIAAAIGLSVLAAGCGSSSNEELTLKQRLLPASTFEGYSAARTFDWQDAHDLLLPCRHTCSTRISRFTVDGIPGSQGVNRIVGVVTPGGPTVDRWVISFVKGPVLYIVERSADAGKLKNGHDDAVEAANREYDRVKDASFPSS